MREIVSRKLPAKPNTQLLKRTCRFPKMEGGKGRIKQKKGNLKKRERYRQFQFPDSRSKKYPWTRSRGLWCRWPRASATISQLAREPRVDRDDDKSYFLSDRCRWSVDRFFKARYNERRANWTNAACNTPRDEYMCIYTYIYTWAVLFCI